MRISRGNIRESKSHSGFRPAGKNDSFMKTASCIYPYLQRDSICSRCDLWFPAIHQSCFRDARRSRIRPVSDKKYSSYFHTFHAFLICRYVYTLSLCSNVIFSPYRSFLLYTIVILCFISWTFNPILLSLTRALMLTDEYWLLSKWFLQKEKHLE